MKRSFNEKVIVITGASSGVGRACARAFARQGARLGLLARSAEGLAATAEEVHGLGGTALVLPCDVSDAAAVYAAADAVERQLGPIDVWINNAMVTLLAHVWDTGADEYARVTAVTYLGYVYGTQAALRSMRPRNRGTILQVGSALEYRSIPLQSAYCGAKAAIRGFTDSLRTELIHEHSAVKITSVQLPAVNTPQFDVMRTRMPRQPMPVPPIYEPEVIADAIVWAARHHPRELVVGSSSLRAIVGQKLAPALSDRYLGAHGVVSQQRDAATQPDRQDNFYEPLPGDRGAHGAFREQSVSASPYLVLRTNTSAIAVTFVATAIVAAVALFRRWES